MTWTQAVSDLVPREVVGIDGKTFPRPQLGKRAIHAPVRSGPACPRENGGPRPQNMALLRQVSHNLMKNETSLKVGIQGKRLQAGWKEDYLLKVLRS